MKIFKKNKLDAGDIAVVIVLMLIAGFVAVQMFPKTNQIQRGFNSIQSVDMVSGSFYNKIVSPEGYMTGDSCDGWMEGFGFIDGRLNWECYLDQADPIESSCDINGCERFTFKCVCYKK